MTVNDVYNSAVKLLGYNNAYLSVEDNDVLKNRAGEIVSRIGRDLCKMPPVSGLLTQVSIPENYEEALIYGTCMLIALSEGDGDKNRVFTDIYNKKRAEVKSSIGNLKDNLPCVCGVL